MHPRFSKEKENSLKDAQNQLNLKQKDYSDFKQKVDEQKAKTESLLQQYLQALPEIIIVNLLYFHFLGTLTFLTLLEQMLV